MFETGATAFYKAIKEVCFPSSCLGCGACLAGCEPPLFCAACRPEIVIIKNPLCPCCGRPYFSKAGENSLCGACLSTRRHFDKARGLALYQGALAQAIHGFKYSGSHAGLSSFAALYNEYSNGRNHLAPDLIIPVPLHPTRLKERGFNQALLLARAFFPHYHSRIAFDLLQRHRQTPPQAGLNGKDRRRNIRDAFRITDPEIVTGRHVLLVDDVYTTGTTVNECARVLKSAGARKVEVITLARVDEEK